jgi:hypothetical protein
MLYLHFSIEVLENIGGMMAFGSPNIYLLVFIFLIIGGAEPGKVFLFAPFLSKSVTITYVPLLEELANRGHQVNNLKMLCRNYLQCFLSFFLSFFFTQHLKVHKYNI